MRDNLLDSVLYRVRERHTPDGNLARTLRNISGLAEQARQIHKENGPAVAQSVIKGELVPKYLRLANEVQTAINAAKDTRIRDDWASGYGYALTCKNTLNSLGRLSTGDWSMAELDARTGSAA